MNIYELTTIIKWSIYLNRIEIYTILSIFFDFEKTELMQYYICKGWLS